MSADLEALIYLSQAYCKELQQYLIFFTSLFGNELISFGYERLNENGFYEAISNQPRIAEIFIENNVYQIMQFVTTQYCGIEHGFIYPNGSEDQSIYNKYRIQLNKELGIYATFYTIETCFNYQHIFVWNFREPFNFISLAKWENQILLGFINNRKSIQYVLDKFKNFYSQNIGKKEVPIKLFNSAIKNAKINSVGTLGERLIESGWLDQEDLYLKDLRLSNKEALFTHFYLKGMSAKEIARKMFVSRRTVEDYIKRIKQKLRVNSRSKLHEAMEKVGLWRKIL